MAHKAISHKDRAQCGRWLRRHMDADEAVALGAAMFAANLSTTFRLGKKFGMADGASYPIIFQVKSHPEILPQFSGMGFRKAYHLLGKSSIFRDSCFHAGYSFHLYLMPSGVDQSMEVLQV